MISKINRPLAKGECVTKTVNVLSVQPALAYSNDRGANEARYTSKRGARDVDKHLTEQSSCIKTWMVYHSPVFPRRIGE